MSPDWLAHPQRVVGGDGFLSLLMRDTRTALPGLLTSFYQSGPKLYSHQRGLSFRLSAT